MPSLASTLVGLALIAHTSAHLSLINIYGSNNVVGHGFGVNLYGKYPRAKGEPGDAGGDSGVFETGTDNPSPACGSTPELGPIDLGAWMGQAEGDGLPAAYANMSVVVEAFQVNRDGGGPMSCEYSEDATTTSWKPMFMTLNQAGNSGIQNSLRTNATVVMNFPADAKCTGGWTQTACIVRCRTGVNKRFGGCFAVKLSDSDQPNLVISESSDSKDTSVVARPVVNESIAEGNTTDLSDEQIRLIANQVIIQMKTDGLVWASSSHSNSNTSETEQNDVPKSRSADAEQSKVNNPAPEAPDAGSNQGENTISSPERSTDESPALKSSDAASNQEDSMKSAPKAADEKKKQDDDSPLSTSTVVSDEPVYKAVNATEQQWNTTDSFTDDSAANNSAIGISDTQDQQLANTTARSNNATLDASDVADNQSNMRISESNHTSGLNHSIIVPVPENRRLVDTTSAANPILATGSDVSEKQAKQATTEHDTHQASKGAALVPIHDVTKPLLNAISDITTSVANNSTLDASDVADNQLYNTTQLSDAAPLQRKNVTSKAKKHVSRCRSTRRKTKKHVV
ncbi:hypothetical protein PGTUg99_013088 [Puccinia graminis f. sp. tritici]|uniref:Uncharacterized protein n=1 Tax=Puccinia graminis f. sp. tritici TaxID=56615 RepID=A0A5B0RHD5_PUCGR|nr:hypothetical protein PGTUg99_013088 [Puccinia graminis f. sp. tritici]